jgi:site-specific DNA recombinase
MASAGWAGSVPASAGWQRARDIAEARSDAHTQRAMSESDYHLTGLITCPECGKKYIGTSAKGRNRLYHYHTCFSRVRYGAAGCDGPRLVAPATDAATLQALLDFYTRADDLIGDAITRAQRHHRDSNADRRGELDAIEAQIKTKNAAIDRYHAAFEAGTMDDDTCGPRLKALRHEIEQLKGRRDEITDTIDAEPTAPPGRYHRRHPGLPRPRHRRGHLRRT